MRRPMRTPSPRRRAGRRSAPRPSDAARAPLADAPAARRDAGRCRAPGRAGGRAPIERRRRQRPGRSRRARDRGRGRRRAEPAAASPAVPAPEPATIDWSRFAAADGSGAAKPVERTPATQSAVRVRAPLLDRLVNQAGEVSITRSRIEAERRPDQAARSADLTEQPGAPARASCATSSCRPKSQMQLAAARPRRRRRRRSIRSSSTASRASRN